jgi:hypothetical protein
MKRILSAFILSVALFVCSPSVPAVPAQQTSHPGQQTSQTQPTGVASIKVWVNDTSHVYHCPGTRWYGATKRGEYMTQKQAQDTGNRPAYGKSCQ